MHACVRAKVFTAMMVPFVAVTVGSGCSAVLGSLKDHAEEDGGIDSSSASDSAFQTDSLPERAAGEGGSGDSASGAGVHSGSDGGTEADSGPEGGTGSEGGLAPATDGGTGSEGGLAPATDGGTGSEGGTGSAKDGGGGSDAQSDRGEPCDLATCPNGCCNAAGACVPFASETSNSCGTNGAACSACALGTGCGTTGVCAKANIAFVSSTAYANAAFGGLAGADAACQTLAKHANLGGTFIAYLSTSTAAAPTRLGSARGWVRTDGQAVADTPKQLAAGNLFYPLLLDESGQPISNNPFVLTGTTSTGAISTGNTCVDWTSSNTSDDAAGGDPYAGYSGFQGNYTLDCAGNGDLLRLYCLQTAENVAVSPPPAQGRLAFITPAPWVPSGGISAADAQCQSDAQQAGLPGTYLALLSTSTASAASRFNMTGTPWVRPDGVRVFAHTADLATFTLAAPIAVAPNGTTYFGNYYTWTGSASPTSAGTTATTCNNWTSNAATPLATVTTAGFTRTANGTPLWGLDTIGCDFTSSLLFCLQE
jgi:hypothetical protein